MLLERGMKEWSEAQVQEWIGVIGLGPEQTEIVRRVLADMVGEELEELGKNTLKNKLEKAGADDAVGLAKQTHELHQAALGDGHAPETGGGNGAHIPAPLPCAHRRPRLRRDGVPVAQPIGPDSCAVAPHLGRPASAALARQTWWGAVGAAHHSANGECLRRPKGHHD